MKTKKQKLEQEMKQRTGSKLGKEYIKVVYSHSACLIYMWNARPDKAQDSSKIEGNQDYQEKYQ